MSPQLGMIWAQGSDGTIGVDGRLPWQLPEDLAHFKEVTLGHPVIMGRRTWDSLPSRFRPLPGRRNIVVTRQQGWAAEGAELASDPASAIKLTRDAETWVIGGGTLYREFIDSADILEVTEVEGDFAGDTVAPQIGQRWSLAKQSPWQLSSAGPRYRFLQYLAR